MPNAKMIAIRDFSGGRNDLLPADQINDNEAVDLINMIPGDEGQPLNVRPGFVRFNQTELADAPVRGLFRYRKKSGAKVWIAACGASMFTTSQQEASKFIPYSDSKIVYSTTAGTYKAFGSDFSRWAVTGYDLLTWNLDGVGNESVNVPRQPVNGARPQLRYPLRTPNAMHQHVFSATNLAAGDIAIIKVGSAANDMNLRTRGEFFVEVRGDGKARCTWRDNKVLQSGAWVTCALGGLTKHTLEWTLDDKYLTVKLDGTVMAGLNKFNFGTTIDSHDNVMWMYKGAVTGGTGDPLTDKMVRVFTMTDIDQHFPLYGEKDRRHRTSKTALSTATYTYTSLLANERLEIMASAASKVKVKLNGSYVQDSNGVDIVLSGSSQTKQPVGVITLPAAQAHTLILEVQAGGELALWGINQLLPNQPFNSIYTKGSGSWGDTDFAIIDDKLMFTDGGQPGIFKWDGVAGSATLLTKSSDTVTTLPTMSFLQPFRKRIFAAGDPNNPSRVYYTAPSDPTNWWGTGVSDGGYIDVDPDNGETVTGLGRMFNGVVVFKERSIYLWTFGDADRPGTEGRIEQLVPGVGLVSHYSVAYYNGQMIFLGQNAEGDFGIYRLMGTGVEEYSVKIPKALKRILANSSRPAKAVAANHLYMVAVDDGTDDVVSRKLTFVLDLRRQCWTLFEGLPVGSWAVDRDKGGLYFGSDDTGFVYQYGNSNTDDGVPIHYRYVSKPFDGKSPLADHRFRNLWVDLNGSSSGEITIGYSLDGGTPILRTESLKIPGLRYWNDGWTWNDGTTWPDGEVERHISIPIPTNRAKHLAVIINGTINDDLAVARYGIAFRERKTRY